MKVQLVEPVGYGIFVGSLHARQCTRSARLAFCFLYFGLQSLHYVSVDV